MEKIFHCEQQDCVHRITLEEDLPGDIENLIKEIDYIEVPSTSNDDNNHTDELNMNEKMSNDKNPEEYNGKDDQNQEMIIDHEECIGETGLLSNTGDLNIILNSNDRHRQVRDKAEQAYLKNAQSQLIKYKNNLAKQHRAYDVGDTVGLMLSA